MPDKLVSILADPVFLFVFGLVLYGLGLSGRPSVTFARFLLFTAWLVGIYGFAINPPVEGVPLTIVMCLFTLLMVGLVAWARPILVPGNVGRLVSRRTIWSWLKKPDRFLEIDSSGIMFHWDGADGQPMFDLHDSRLAIERYGKRILISTLVRDRKGNIVAELIRNEWKVSQSAYDRNYNKDSLEVLNSEGDVVLQVRVLPDRIQIQGEWHGADGHATRFEAAPPALGGAMRVIITPTSPPELRRNTIQRMFRYPSDLHFGELAK